MSEWYFTRRGITIKFSEKTYNKNEIIKLLTGDYKVSRIYKNKKGGWTYVLLKIRINKKKKTKKK